MTFINEPTVTSWDARELLQIINPDNLDFCCVGYAPSQRRRCRNPIARHNRESAMLLLKSLPGLSQDVAILRKKLSHLAELALCRRWHQGQVVDVVEKWCAMIVEELGLSSQSPHEQGTGSARQTLLFPLGSAPAVEHGRIELARRKANETARRQHAEDKCRSEEQHEAKRKQAADHLEAERREAESRRETEREQARERERISNRRREQDCRDKERQEQDRREQERRKQRQKEGRERLEQEKRAWAASWSTYETGWTQISQLTAMTSTNMRCNLVHSLVGPLECTYGGIQTIKNPDWNRLVRAIRPEYHPRYLGSSKDPDGVPGDARDILPWPVRSGTWQEVDERRVKEFFQHGAIDARQDHAVFVRMLKTQALRWHPDRMCRFPALAGSEDVMRCVGLVAQVINGMIAKAREGADA